jgi:hypothetical protein
VRASHVRTVKEFADEGGEGKSLDIEGLVKRRVLGELGSHWRRGGCASRHAEVLEDVLHVLGLRESKSVIGEITGYGTPEKPRRWAEVVDVKARGEGGFEGGDEGTETTSND